MNMYKLIRYCAYFVMTAIGLLIIYVVLHAGSPDSLVRSVLPDPAMDRPLALIGGVVIFLLFIFIHLIRDRETFQYLAESYANEAKTLRLDGRTDEQIADYILASVGSRPGRRHDLARRKIIKHLSRVK